eukprot:TRINITY_DN9602_c0_g1_i8.p1 TRINITY_DN9602_c0_g1~~TRINITY_DN9602_c0_g1_i8.p1  ORF type:complete len:217 (+),score=48.61 TRINITY_DN9602_c0_g1_i8:77-727(+)
MGLCSKCFRQLETSAQQIPESRVVEHLLRQAGYKSMDHARKTLLFRELYPDVSSGSEAENLPGVTTWLTTIHPVTQFDKVPQRGASACTFIAAVTVVRFAMRTEWPTQEIWADSIGRGVQAYHNAKAAKSDEHADIDEALPFVMPTLGLNIDTTGLLTHTTVVTLIKPTDISEADFLAMIGEQGFKEFGKKVQGHTSVSTQRRKLQFKLLCIVQSF